MSRWGVLVLSSSLPRSLLHPTPCWFGAQLLPAPGSAAPDPTLVWGCCCSHALWIQPSGCAAEGLKAQEPELLGLSWAQSLLTPC